MRGSVKGRTVIFSQRDFRDALGMFPSGVCVISGRASDDRPIGITASSFTSVSLDPPLISFNVSKSLRSFADILGMETFVVSVLTESQSVVSSGFAQAGSDKWACTEFKSGRTSNPVIVPNIAVFECHRYGIHEAGDHMLILGRVVHFEIDESAQPLVYFRGKYRRMGELIEFAA